MPTAEAEVRTGRASRYLVQLCRHLGQMGGMGHRPTAHHGGQEPLAVRRADWSESSGTVRFAQGTCTLQASADALTLRVEADDEDALRRIQEGITRRLGMIGRRVALQWRQSTSPARDGDQVRPDPRSLS